MSERYWRAHRDTLIRLDRPFMDKHRYWAMKRHKNPESHILESCGAQDVLYEYETDRRRCIEAADYLSHDTLQEGARPVLEQAAGVHEQVLVTLRRNAANLSQQLKNLDLRRYFSVVLCAAPTTHPRWKVKVDLIRTCLDRREERTWFHLLITDTDTDVRSGQELGLRTLAIANGIRERAILEAAGPDLVLDRTSDIPDSGFLFPED